LHIALSQKITVYDALFMASVQEINATLYTADKKLCVKADKPIRIKLLTKE